MTEFIVLYPLPPALRQGLVDEKMGNAKEQFLTGEVYLRYNAYPLFSKLHIFNFDLELLEITSKSACS
jgi:hypothetical protein